MINRPAIIEGLLAQVDRPLRKRLEDTRAEIATLHKRRTENVEASVQAGGDAKLAAARRDIDTQIEDKEAVCAKLETQVPLEDALLLADELDKAREADREEAQNVKVALDKYLEAERLAKVAGEEHGNALRHQAKTHGRTFSLYDAIRAHRNVHPAIYDSSEQSAPVFSGEAA